MALGGLWELLVDGICRPPRDDQYGVEDLVGGSRSVFQVANAVGVREDIIVLNRRGLKLACSHYKPTGVRGKDGKLPCVIYSHCNSGSRRDAEEAVFLLIPLGISVFTVDFAGSGVSDGEWVTLGASESEDLEAVLSYLRSSGQASTIGLWGRSMGAVTALMYAHKDSGISAMVLDSPFCRLTDLITEVAQQLKLPIPRYFLKRAVGAMRRSVQKRAGFDINTVSPLDIVHKCKIPALFGHGTEDSHIGIEHSRKLHNAYAGERSIIFFGGNHLTIRPEFFYITVAVFFHRNMQVQQLLEGAPPLDLETLEQLAAVVTGLLESRAAGEDVEDESLFSAQSAATERVPHSARSGSPKLPQSARSQASGSTAYETPSVIKRKAGEFERDTFSNHSTIPATSNASPTYSSTTEHLAPSTPGSNDPGNATIPGQPPLPKQKPTHVMDMLRGRLNASPPSKQAAIKRASTAHPSVPAGPDFKRTAQPGGTWSDSGSEPASPRQDDPNYDQDTKWFLHSRTVTENGLVVCEYTGPASNRKYRWRVVPKDEEESKTLIKAPVQEAGQPGPGRKLQRTLSDPSQARPSTAPARSSSTEPKLPPAAPKFPPSSLNAIAERPQTSPSPTDVSPSGEVWKVQSRVPTAEGTVLCEYCGDPPNRRYRWRVLGADDDMQSGSLLVAPDFRGAEGQQAPPKKEASKEAPKKEAAKKEAARNPLQKAAEAAKAAAAADQAGKGEDDDTEGKPEKEGEWKLQNKVSTAEGLLVCEYKGGFLNRQYRWRIIPHDADVQLNSASNSDMSSSPRSSVDSFPPEPRAPLNREPQEYAVLRSQQPTVTPKGPRASISQPRNIQTSASNIMDSSKSSIISSGPNVLSSTHHLDTIHSMDMPRRPSMSNDSSVIGSSEGDENDQALLSSVLEATGVGSTAEGVTEDVLQLYHSLDASTLMTLVQLHSGQGMGEFDMDPLLPTIKEKDEDADRDQSAPSAKPNTSTPQKLSTGTSTSTTGSTPSKPPSRPSTAPARTSTPQLKNKDPLLKPTSTRGDKTTSSPEAADFTADGSPTADASKPSITTPANIPASAKFSTPTKPSSAARNLSNISTSRPSSANTAAATTKVPSRPASPEAPTSVGCSPWTCSGGSSGGTKRKSSGCVIQ